MKEPKWVSMVFHNKGLIKQFVYIILHMVGQERTSGIYFLLFEPNEVSVEEVQCRCSGCWTDLEVNAGSQCVTTDVDE